MVDTGSANVRTRVHADTCCENRMSKLSEHPSPHMFVVLGTTVPSDGEVGGGVAVGDAVVGATLGVGGALGVGAALVVATVDPRVGCDAPGLVTQPSASNRVGSGTMRSRRSSLPVTGVTQSSASKPPVSPLFGLRH